MPTDGPTVVAGWRNIVTGEPYVRSKNIIIMETPDLTCIPTLGRSITPSGHHTHSLVNLGSLPPRALALQYCQQDALYRVDDMAIQDSNTLTESLKALQTELDVQAAVELTSTLNDTMSSSVRPLPTPDCEGPYVRDDKIGRTSAVARITIWSKVCTNGKSHQDQVRAHTPK